MQRPLLLDSSVAEPAVESRPKGWRLQLRRELGALSYEEQAERLRPNHRDSNAQIQFLQAEHQSAPAGAQVQFAGNSVRNTRSLISHTTRVAEHLARLLRRAEVGGVPAGEPVATDDTNDRHWWTEIKAFCGSIVSNAGRASRRQCLRELTSSGHFTEAQIQEIEAALAEAAVRQGESTPQFLSS